MDINVVVEVGAAFVVIWVGVVVWGIAKIIEICPVIEIGVIVMIIASAEIVIIWDVTVEVAAGSWVAKAGWIIEVGGSRVGICVANIVGVEVGIGEGWVVVKITIRSVWSEVRIVVYEIEVIVILVAAQIARVGCFGKIFRDVIVLLDVVLVGCPVLVVPFPQFRDDPARFVNEVESDHLEDYVFRSHQKSKKNGR